MKSTRLGRAIRLTTLAAIAAPATVFAGGFSLNEQSASAMGVANAGAAANPENASTVFFNPAGMSQLKGTNLSFGVAVLDIDAEAKSASATDVVGGPVRGSTGDDIADLAVLPNFFITHEINDSIDVGFGIHAPYGLAADYDDDFVGRYFADKTELTAISFTPSIAINNGKGLSMGLGLNVLYAEARLTKFQDIRGALVRQTGSAAAADQLANTYEASFGAPYSDINGDDIAVNFRVGFLYELSDRTQFGLTAQTGTELELEGNAEITGFPKLTSSGLAPGTLNEDAQVPLAIPESITVGARHQLNDSVTLLAGATYARWSRFEGLDVFSTEGDSGEISTALGRTGDQPLSHVTEKWQNTWQFNVGGIWQATPAWAFKAGYAWDESPVDEFVTARVPSSDRHWLTLGTQWKDTQSGWTVDAAVGTLVFTDDPKINEFVYKYDAPSQKDPAAGKSNYKGEYELDAWSASLQISKAF
jgi:long-chain fatty acid transport protein